MFGKFSSQNSESSRNKIMHLETLECMISKMALLGYVGDYGKIHEKNPSQLI